MEVWLYKCYVDDVNIVCKAIEAGTGYENGQLTTTAIPTREEAEEPSDKRTMSLIKLIANDIHPSMKVEIDFPSNHEDDKMPILDLKVWLEVIDDRTTIMHEFYSKEVSSKLMVHSRSAIPWQSKRTVLTQEVLRVLLNCSLDLPWEQKAAHISNMTLRMQYSGYSKKFRYQVVTSALNAYKKLSTQ